MAVSSPGSARSIQKVVSVMFVGSGKGRAVAAPLPRSRTYARKRVLGARPAAPDRRMAACGRVLRGIKGHRNDGFAMRKMRLRVVISSEFFDSRRSAALNA